MSSSHERLGGWPRRAPLHVSSLVCALLFVAMSTPITGWAQGFGTVDERTPTPATEVRPLVLAADLAATGVGVAVALAHPFGADDVHGRVGRGVATTAMLGFVVAPNLYWIQGRGKHGFRSAIVRAVGPVLGTVTGILGVCIAEKDAEGCARVGAVYGTGAGTVAAFMVDAFFISNLRLRDSADRGTPWYGWQTLIADAAGLMVGLGIYASGAHEPVTDAAGVVAFPASAWAGLALFGIAGGPAVHFLNGRPVTALESLALRLFGAPLLGLGGLVTYCAAVGGETGCSSPGVSWGFLGGAAFIAGLDAALLARRAPDADDSSPASETKVSLVPTVMGEGNGLALSVPF